ncbi:PQQ-dependent sugar dehydrogenase [Nitrososphaera sp.]|uniref:PQQ-dependent sugar dehydrogenase n=1 Tax=Nitrososphaera sp. TaxID=1971748 RepID=UPI00317ECBD3
MRRGLIAAIAGIAVAAAIAAGVAAWQPTAGPAGIGDGLGTNDTISADKSPADPFTPIPDSNLPRLSDPSLKVEKVVEGLSAPTSMVFVGDDMIITQKNDGNVRLVVDGTLQRQPALTFDVENASERGLLGVAYSENRVFFYLTESTGLDTRQRVYRYDLQDGTLANRAMILDLPGTPGPNHDGGKILVGPDGYLYAVIGDLNRNGMLQNYVGGPAPDDTSVILKVDFDGRPVADVLSGRDGLASYYAYGIRNGFGLDFDPLTDTLWMTENGPNIYDEINIVEPGFNSGWERVMGPISRTSADEGDLVMFEGAHYADPLFSWREPVGVTDMEFLNSTLLGERYENNIFAGDINNGNLYYFEVNEERDGLVLGGALSDLVADSDSELEAVTIGTGFRGITDVETGPDGYLYVLSYSGSVYRIVPAR